MPDPNTIPHSVSCQKDPIPFPPRELATQTLGQESFETCTHASCSVPIIRKVTLTDPHP